MDKSIKIFVPASSANLGAGFDVIGACLDIWNEIKMALSDDLNLKVTLYETPRNFVTYPA